MAGTDHRLTRTLVEPDHHAMRRLLELYREGHLRPHVGATYDLPDIGDALRHVQQSRTPGKTVIHTNRGAHA
ncbi:zinc-binding dehydrogenase [Prescottella defluvii]|nr:zinc-binding dehydrogenase [Prescottella defluvii]